MLNKYLNKSLGTRFSIILTGVMVSVFILLSIVIAVHNVNTMTDKLDKRLSDLSSLVEKSLPSALWQYEHNNIFDFVEALFIQEDIVFISVSGESETITEKVRPQYKGKHYNDFFGSSGFLAREIVITHNEVNVGKVQVVLSQLTISNTIFRNTLTSILVLLILIIVISVTAIIIIKKFILKPIQLLKDSTDKIASGNMEAAIDISSGDEIGQLARRFEHMQTSIKKSIDKIRKTDELTKVNIRLENEITERKKAEEELTKYRDHLEDLVKERTEELEIAKTRAESADRTKTIFLETMSHELLTPLNAIIGFSGIALQGMSGELKEEQRDHISRIFKAGNHLRELVRAVFDVVKIEAGRVELFPELFMLRAIIDEASDSMQEKLKEKKLSLATDIDADLLIFADRKKLLQCITNLLSNAEKFTEKGGISINAREIDNDIEISVIDTGIGIPAAELEKIFQPFERLESRLKVKAGHRTGSLSDKKTGHRGTERQY